MEHYAKQKAEMAELELALNIEDFSKGDLVAFLDKLVEHAARYPDPEYTHIMADRALIRFVADPRVEAKFASLEKWYE